MPTRSTIGTDPEFFITKHGKLKSAIGIIPGTKENPHQLKCNSGLQVDNVALEFNTRIANDGEDLVEAISDSFKEILNYIPDGHKLTVLPSAVFDDDELDNDEAKHFGCSADFNAWTLETNPIPTHHNPNFRSCGGHIHVGHVEGDGNEFLLDPFGKVELVKAMDTFHGLISVQLDHSDEAIERRKLYGKSGCHRPTEYGVEYRVLSNFWMKSPTLVMLMDSLTQDCLKLIRDDKLSSLIKTIGDTTIQEIIDYGKLAEAKMIIKKYVLPLLSKNSIYYFTEAAKNINNYVFNKEWALEA